MGTCRVALQITNAGDCTQEAGHHVERDIAGVRLAYSDEQLGFTVGCDRGKIAHEAGFANAGLSHNPYDAAVAGDRAFQQALDRRHFPSSTDKIRRSTSDHTTLVAHTQQAARGYTFR